MEQEKVETAVLTTAEIKRSAQQVKPEPYAELLVKAREVLGYKPRDNRLNNVLAELGIETLSHAQVTKYMESKRTDTHRFVQYELENYNLPIPIHVLNKAIQIKERLPEARFQVYNYEQGGSNAGDPFLWVSVNSWGWYIEVWEEAEFEGRAEQDDDDD